MSRVIDWRVSEPPKEQLPTDAEFRVLQRDRIAPVIKWLGRPAALFAFGGRYWTWAWYQIIVLAGVLVFFAWLWGGLLLSHRH